MGKGIHGTWGLKLAQEAEDVRTHCDGYQARFRDRLCYSQYPGLSKGIRSVFLSGWVRNRGMSAILRYQVAKLVLSNVWSARPAKTKDGAYSPGGASSEAPTACSDQSAHRLHSCLSSQMYEASGQADQVLGGQGGVRKGLFLYRCSQPSIFIKTKYAQALAFLSPAELLWYLLQQGS